ncbi:hypothetical protein EV426DRAFT_669349 [Tirmania nivea]|nr:hypothetical protein EV426DRAFT_669349 [Tirmania nivea]
MEMERQMVGGGGEEMQCEKGMVVESGYSSMVSSQREGQGQNQSQGRQMLGEEKLRELAGNGVVMAEQGEGEGEGEGSDYLSLLMGTQGRCVGDGGGNGVGGDLVRGGSIPVLSRFVPLPPPPPHTLTVQSQEQVHPASTGARPIDGLPPLLEKIEEVVPRLSSPPSTPPKIHVSIHQQNSNNVVSASTSASGSPPPPAVAGAKRTSSGKVKATVALGILGSGAASMPGSPMEVVVSPTETSVGVGTVGGDGRLGMGLSSLEGAVDPGRIQELSTQLRTRLKYARIKVDNNWTTKSLDQVESIYHSNQNSPVRSSNNNSLPTLRIKSDSPTAPADGFGPPIHPVVGGRRGHSRTNSEQGSHQYRGMGTGMGAQGTHGPGCGAGQGNEKTYESFWKERAPFTTKMLEKMTTTTGGPQGQLGGQYYQQQGQVLGQHQQSQCSQQYPPHHHNHHHHPLQQPYFQVRSPAPGGENGHAQGHYPSSHHSHPNHHLHPQRQQQQATIYSPSHRTIRPPPTLNSAHSNLSTYSETSTTTTIQTPATPIRHPTLSRGTSSKSAEEEAVESLMFLMSSPGNNSTPRREPRMVQGHALNMPRRGSILSRENSNGWGGGGVGNNGEVDLDVTDAEGGSGSGMEGGGEEDEVPPILDRRVEGGRGGEEAEAGLYARRRSNSGSGVMGERFERDGRLGVPGGGGVKLKHHHPHHTVGVHVGPYGHGHGHQERVTKPSAGSTPKKKLGVGMGIVGNGTPQGTPGARRLAPGFSPS